MTVLFPPFQEGCERQALDDYVFVLDHIVVAGRGGHEERVVDGFFRGFYGRLEER